MHVHVIYNHNVKHNVIHNVIKHIIHTDVDVKKCIFSAMALDIDLTVRIAQVQSYKTVYIPL